MSSKGVIKRLVLWNGLNQSYLLWFFFKDKGEVAKKEMEVKKEQLSVATEEAQSRGNQKTELGNIVKKKKQALKFTQVRHYFQTINTLTHLRLVPVGIC